MNSVLSATPILHSQLNDLPQDLVNVLGNVSGDRQKDMVLLSVLTALGAAITNVSTIYGDKEVFPNINVFVTAPAANGKGTLEVVRMLFDRYHNSLRNIAGNEEQHISKFFLPGDSSSAAFKMTLKENNGCGLIYESEADTITNTISKEWGDYSDLLRKAFHQEKIAQSRIKDGGIFEIEKPKLGVLLAGTPDQVYTMMPSSQNGLFSRFLYYAFAEETKFVSPRPRADKPLGERLEGSSASMQRLLHTFSGNEHFTVKFSDDQWDKHEEVMQSILNMVVQENGADSASIVFRLGLVCMKLAMIFTCLRSYSGAFSDDGVIKCCDSDFINALLICQTMILHSQIIYDSLPKKKDLSLETKSLDKMFLFEKLNNQFERKHILELFKSNGVGERQMYNTLLRWTKQGIIMKVRNGIYRKTG